MEREKIAEKKGHGCKHWARSVRFQQVDTNGPEMLIPKVASNFQAPHGNEDLH